MVQPYLEEAISAHALPTEFIDTVNRWYLPLAHKIAECRQSHPLSPLVLGIQGTQGSGKSTLADFLSKILTHDHHLQCATLSIDDFYLTHSQRQSLATQIHPLLATRGVPGTHDIPLARSTISAAKTLSAHQPLALARFDKASDDRAPESTWPIVRGPLDVIILEGWCVGLTAQPEATLQTPINTLEKDEDPDGVWRGYVNHQLKVHYQALFQQIDKLVVLKAPSFDCVYQWRLLQEQKLAVKTPSGKGSQILAPAQVSRFIAHFQRLTEHGLQTLPAQADWLLLLNEDHAITHFSQKDKP